MNNWRMILIAAVFAATPGLAAAQDAQAIFDQAVKALNELVPTEDRPAPPPAQIPAEPPLPMPRPDDRLPPRQGSGDAGDEVEVAASATAAPEEAEAEVPDTAGDDAVPLPAPRPDDAEAPPVEPADSGEPEPDDEPARVYQSACPAMISGLVEAQMIAPVAEGQCGLQSPLEVTAVRIAGRRVPLSQPAIVNCAMAGELARWAGRIDTYTEATFNQGLLEILSGTSYFCRGRNNVAEADISEHGFGNAIDVTGFALEDGKRISLPSDWGDDSAEAAAMELAHGTACGFFTTVLGPEANALHRDHLHLDLGCHGRRCTARLCE